MSTDYPDYQVLSFIQEQSAAFYYAEVFRKLDSDVTIDDKRLIASAQAWYVWDSLTISETGRFIVLGEVTVFGD